MAAAGSIHHQPNAEFRVRPASVTQASIAPIPESHPSAWRAWLGMPRAILRLPRASEANTTAETPARTMPDSAELLLLLAARRYALSAMVANPTIAIPALTTTRAILS